MYPFLQTQEAAPLMVPDSIQKEQFQKAVDTLINLDWSQAASGLLEQATWVLIKLVIALVIYYIGRWLIRRLVKLLDRTFERRNVDVSLRSFIRNTASVVLTLVLVMIAVQTLGVNVTSLIAIFSAATLAIGMALSGTAQNFAGGVMILMVKPYRVGDYITAEGQSGTVQEIKLFSTVITTVDNQTIYIPNNVIATGIIDNYSTATTRRAEWTLMLTYGDDVEAARKLILGMLTEEKRILPDPAPVVWIAALENNGVRLTVRAWVKNDDLWDVFFEYNERFYNELPKAGLHFALQQHEILVKEDNNLLKNE